MKQLKWAALGAALCCSALIGASVASAATHYQIRVNGAYVSPDVPPIVQNGRMLVSARWIADALGAHVSYESSDQTAVITTSAHQPGLEVVSASPSGGSITGTIINGGAQSAHSVICVATLWDRSGSVIGSPTTTKELGTLAPGAKAYFTIPLTAAESSGTAAFEVVAKPSLGKVGTTMVGAEFATGGSLNLVQASVTLNAVSTPASITSTQFGSTDTPQPGDEFVAVNVTAYNDGTQSVDFSALNELYIQDGAGHRYTANIEATIDEPDAFSASSTLSPAQKVTGTVVFDVPTTARNLELVWNDATENQSFWSLGLQ